MFTSTLAVLPHQPGTPYSRLQDSIQFSSTETYLHIRLSQHGTFTYHSLSHSLSRSSRMLTLTCLALSSITRIPSQLSLLSISCPPSLPLSHPPTPLDPSRDSCYVLHCSSVTRERQACRECSKWCCNNIACIVIYSVYTCGLDVWDCSNCFG